MNIRKKKIIAKEIIYLLAWIFCVIVIWLFIEIRGLFLNKKLDQIQKEITTCQKRIDSLKEKILPIGRMIQLENNLTTMIEQGASREDISEYTKDFRDKFKKSDVLNKISELKDYKINLEKQVYKIKSSLINNDIAAGFTKWIALILLVILYPLRLIYIAGIWSFRTLRQNSNN